MQPATGCRSPLRRERNLRRIPCSWGAAALPGARPERAATLAGLCARPAYASLTLSVIALFTKSRPARGGVAFLARSTRSVTLERSRLKTLFLALLTGGAVAAFAGADAQEAARLSIRGASTPDDALPASPSDDPSRPGLRLNPDARQPRESRRPCALPSRRVRSRRSRPPTAVPVRADTQKPVVSPDVAREVQPSLVGLPDPPGAPLPPRRKRLVEDD